MALREGYLTKEGHAAHTWKRRWFILEHGVLQYFESPESATPLGTILLAGATIRGVRMYPNLKPHSMLAILCMLCCAVLCSAMLRYATLCYAMLCCATLCYAMLCYAMLCYAMLCYAVLCYAMLCYAML
jgi:hypothetical protein